METMQVKCPWCSAVLKIMVQPQMDDKPLTCPVCKKTSKFNQYKKVVPKTQIFGADDSETKVNPGGAFNSNKLVIGKLVIPTSGLSFQLRLGRNIVGRKASSSSANHQIPTGENKRMSREHLLIDVRRAPTSGFEHRVSLFKERENKTYINNTQLLFGDTLILQHGDIIKLPDLTIRFEIPDEEATTL